MDAWPSMAADTCIATMTDLRNYLHKLRAMPTPTPAYIRSCNSRPAYDHRLNNNYLYGLFALESDFNDFLVGPVARCPRKELVNHYR